MGSCNFVRRPPLAGERRRIFRGNLRGHLSRF